MVNQVKAVSILMLVHAGLLMVAGLAAGGMVIETVARAASRDVPAAR